MNTQIDTGGPAFPVAPNKYESVAGIGLSGPGEQGMTLRDYLAAHAPPMPHDYPWEPNMPTPCPKEQYAILPLMTPLASLSELKALSLKMTDITITNQREIDKWLEERRRAMFRQWPYFWADMQVAEKRRTEGEE